MKLWHKMLVAPFVAILFLLAVGGLAWHMLNRQEHALQELAQVRMTASQLAADAAAEVSEVHSGVYRLFTWIGNMKEAEIRQAGSRLQSRVDGLSQRLAKLAGSGVLGADERKAIEDALPTLARYRKLMLDAIDMSSIDVATGAMAMQSADVQYQAVLAQMHTLVEMEKKLADQSYQEGTRSSRAAVLTVAAIVACAVLASLVIAAIMSAAIARRLRDAVRVADAISQGDLTVSVDTHGADETADLLRSMDAMAHGLRTLAGEVAAAARVVADTSAQLAQGNQDLSQRTEEQASTLEETASSMEELTSTVTQNAEHATEASRLADGASQVAHRGGGVVADVIRRMTGISESSKKIAEIIGVIDGIAFQTNILALNAAVEAARAGEQGRGFAVVAGEVRALAQRSADAAKQIKALIADSVAQVDAGNRLVGEAGGTMQEIVDAVAKASELIRAIAAASQEQASGIGQVNTAITQMDQVVQHNASLVEEAAAATQSMNHEASGLTALVARFRLSDAQAEPIAPPPADLRQDGAIAYRPGPRLVAAHGMPAQGVAPTRSQSRRASTRAEASAWQG